MLLQRQKALINLLNALGGEVAGTDFQKLLFLFTREFQSEPSYDFVPYKYGGFSFTSYADKRRLTDRGLLEDDDQCWQLSAVGRTQAKPDHPTAVALHKFSRRYGRVRGEQLLADLYDRYPYYASRSEILDRVLSSERSRRRVQQALLPPTEAALLTIGYEGKSLEGYLNQLLQQGVTVLCDVRRNPISRKYGFSKSTLGKACQNVGIAYEHLPSLGIDSGQRQNLRTQADYDALFETYQADHLPKQTEALSRIIDWLRSGNRVALTCFELHSGQCHRHCVAEAIGKLTANEVQTIHLEEICQQSAC